MRRTILLLLMLAACGDDGGGTGATPTPSATGNEPPQITANDFSFSPRTLNVAVGTTVTVRNNGQAPHTWTHTGDFDVALDGRGATGEFTFAKAGTYNYVCKIHEGRGMTGTVVVT